MPKNTPKKSKYEIGGAQLHDMASNVYKFQEILSRDFQRSCRYKM